MPIDVTTTAVIDRPRRQVAEFACDPLNAPRWYANIDEVERLDDGPLAVGSRMRFSARLGPRRLTYVYEVTELEPGRRMVMRTADGPFPMETTYEFENATGGGTLVRLRNRGGPGGWARLVSPLMAAAVRRANRKDLAALRETLTGPETG